ncbi:AraC family transcriptional regulator [Pelagicoccus mobilis]|uniref:DNA-binding transcriptional regulator n=1 Tax=Pelagicoccus mobilis TaxID=415221 RepID=A0A934S1C2_9BACT|nr:DNA-binding transcriptional regulator [Pelagicoccus mobilis]MBK1879209.1 DNA-binding transcriptional regulator [Pelagicoccus mobilis]
MPQRHTAKTKPKKVALLIETSRAYGRGLLEGVAQFNQSKFAWSAYFEPAGLGRNPPPWLKDWAGDGILARISDRSTANLLLSKKLPLVDLRGILSDLPVPFVGIDNQSIAQLAYQHFQDKGFKRFAIVGAPSEYHPHLDQRLEYFKEIVHINGHTCLQFTDTRFGKRKATWEAQQRKLGKWLQSLPANTAVLCVDDQIARETIDAANRVELSVPEDLAVLGVDNDEYLCTLSPTPISSIVTDAAQVGYSAAQLLDELMRNPNKKVPNETLIPSSQVITRASTDILATESKTLTRALEFIKQHACDPISVEQVVERSPVCRTLLEREFKATLGRSVFKEILRTKIAQAQDLLANSNRTLDDIAEDSGFQSAIYLSQVFRRELGTTPGKWRKSQIQ